MVTMANSEDPVEIPQTAVFVKSLHCLIKIKSIFREKINIIW